MKETILKECTELAKLLIKKNDSYGNSAAEPLKVFSNISRMEQIDIRIDDKLNRIKNGKDFGKEDTELDLIGYLILKRCIRRKENAERQTKGESDPINKTVHSSFEDHVRYLRGANTVLEGLGKKNDDPPRGSGVCKSECVECETVTEVDTKDCGLQGSIWTPFHSPTHTR